MEIKLDDKDNSKWLTRPDSYLQPQSQKYKTQQNMNCSHKNSPDNDITYYAYD